METEPTLLFVYGTLKRGDVRAYLLDNQTFIGEATTQPVYRLFNTGDYPALVEAAALGMTGRAIVGELWRVDALCLARLDEEEGVDEGLYRRVAIEMSEPGPAVQGYVYMLSVDGMADCGDRWPVG